MGERCAALALGLAVGALTTARSATVVVLAIVAARQGYTL